MLFLLYHSDCKWLIYQHNSGCVIGSGQSLEQQCLHFEEIFVISCTRSCQNDNFRCSQWRRFHQNDPISVSVIVWLSGNQPLNKSWILSIIRGMMTSSNGNIFRVTGPLCGEFTGPREFPTLRPVTRSFDVFFDLRLNKRLSKQPLGWWFETPAWSLWRHRNGK